MLLNQKQSFLILIAPTIYKVLSLEMAKKAPIREEENKDGKVKAFLLGGKVLTEDSDLAREIYNQSRFGTVLESKKVQLSYIEALYLAEKGKIALYNRKKGSILMGL